MGRYPGYRFATEWQAETPAAAPPESPRFLRVGRDHSWMTVAGLFATPDTARPLVVVARSSELPPETQPGTPEAEERLLVMAYQRLDADRSRARNAYIPDRLKPWAARIHLGDHQTETLAYVMAETETGARHATAEHLRLKAENDPDARFNAI